MTSLNDLPTSLQPEIYAAALREFPISALYAKLLELRNSISHLISSNVQLAEYPDDPDCVDALRENAVVLERMNHRVSLFKAEVAERGMSWEHFDRLETLRADDLPLEEDEGDADGGVPAADAAAGPNGRHQAWQDGTFTTGRISNGVMTMDERPTPVANGTTEMPVRQQAQESSTTASAPETTQSQPDTSDTADGGLYL